MSIDWGFVFFMVWLCTATLGVLVLVLLIIIIHLYRAKLFDVFYLKSPHFSEDEKRKFKLDIYFRFMLTLTAMALISFPKWPRFRFRKLGDIKKTIPQWYRALIIGTYVWMTLCIVIVFGTMAVYNP